MDCTKWIVLLINYSLFLNRQKSGVECCQIDIFLFCVEQSNLSKILFENIISMINRLLPHVLLELMNFTAYCRWMIDNVVKGTVSLKIKKFLLFKYLVL